MRSTVEHFRYSTRANNKRAVRRMIKNYLAWRTQYEREHGWARRDFTAAESMLTALHDLPKRFGKGEWILLQATAQSPYDGCFWEPNFWFLSPDFTIFFPLYVSHRAWSSYAQSSFSAFLVGEVLRSNSRPAWDEWEAHVVRPGNPISPGLVHPRFAQSIVRYYSQRICPPPRFFDFEPPQCKCACCGRLFDEEPFTHEADYYGIGGLATATDRLYCEECYCHGCTVCGYPLGEGGGDYLSEEEAKRLNEEEGPYCENCFPEERCSKCGKYTRIDKLRHGFCETCADEILAEVADQLRRGESPHRCPLCDELTDEPSPHPTHCKKCWNKEMGYAES